jgi:hypothetical protein
MTGEPAATAPVEPVPACAHERFNALVNVHRITNGDGGPIVGYMADVKVACAQCGEPFVFLGLPAGANLKQPMCSPLGEEARLPIGPVSVVNPAALAVVSQVIQ